MTCGVRSRCFSSLLACSRCHVPWMCPLVRRALGASGLFVPKPSRCADYQVCMTLDLEATVRQCPRASAAGGGGCYSLGYSIARGQCRVAWDVVSGHTSGQGVTAGLRSAIPAIAALPANRRRRSRSGLPFPRGLPITAFHPAQRASCRTSWARRQTSSHPQEHQAGQARHAPGQQRCIRCGALAEHQEAAVEEQVADLPSRHVYREPQVAGCGSQVPTHDVG